MHSTAARKDGCDYNNYNNSVRTHGWKQLFLEVKILRLEKLINGWLQDSCQKKYNILQRMNVCYSFCDKNRYLTPKEGC